LCCPKLFATKTAAVARPVDWAAAEAKRVAAGSALVDQRSAQARGLAVAGLAPVSPAAGSAPADQGWMVAPSVLDPRARLVVAGLAPADREWMVAASALAGPDPVSRPAAVGWTPVDRE